jgi:hypothetical protein
VVQRRSGVCTDYPLCCRWRKSNQLSCVLYSTLSSYTTTDSPLCSACRYSNRLSAALLCLSILQLTIRSTDYPLCSLWRYSNRPSALSDITTTDCPLYSETAAVSLRSKTERLSAQLCLSMLQTTICCASLLPL